MPCCYALAALLRFLYRLKCLKRLAGILRKMERTLGCGRSVMLLRSVTGRTVAVGCCIHTSTLHQPHIRLFVCQTLHLLAAGCAGLLTWCGFQQSCSSSCRDESCLYTASPVAACRDNVFVHLNRAHQQPKDCRQRTAVLRGGERLPHTQCSASLAIAC